MFSGLTNHVTSWIDNIKENRDEKSTSLLHETDTNNTNTPNKLSTSKIEGITGWFKTNIPNFLNNKEDDKSSDASGETTKDSSFEIENDQPTATSAKEEITLKNMETTVLAGAKSLGNLFYSAIDKAEKTVAEATSKIKKSVEKLGILDEFNKEQSEFIKDQSTNVTSAVPPWFSCLNEQNFRSECLTLSTDKRNFIKSPPAGVNYEFDYDMSYPMAIAIMKQDPNLEKMRYNLVPRVISERNFWKNYFYRLSLICHAYELSFISNDKDTKSGTNLMTSDVTTNSINIDQNNHEFVSDTLEPTTEDLIEVQEGMKKLIMGSKTKDEDWERELEAELDDYELTNEQKPENNRLELEIEEMSLE
ncbi:synapse-associated protein of 47 kDa-like [Aethina tumida]|uniref:synapse-associated protein of 47 kDa-like n=1 Tax=Aethina tumida TaxID=116153 RepID=UPI0021492D2F|nr:synapse-associated protein of 47 kDa-like [Aethina tumida]